MSALRKAIAASLLALALMFGLTTPATAAPQAQTSAIALAAAARPACTYSLPELGISNQRGTFGKHRAHPDVYGQWRSYVLNSTTRWVRVTIPWRFNPDNGAFYASSAVAHVNNRTTKKVIVSGGCFPDWR